MNMKKDGKDFNLTRVEIVSRTFNEQGQIIKEEWEYYYPTKPDIQIHGFKKK